MAPNFEAVVFYCKFVVKLRNTNDNKEGPWALDIDNLNPCQERMLTTKYNSHSVTLKSILDITQIINKAYQVT